MGGAAHVLDPPPGIAAAEADDAREKARHRAGAREAVIVHAQPEIAVDARGVRGEETAIDVPHHLCVFGGGVAVAVLFPLTRAVPERGRQPEIARPTWERARPRHRQAKQRVDSLQGEIG